MPGGNVIAALVETLDLVVLDVGAPFDLVVAHRQREAAGEVLGETDEESAARQVLAQQQFLRLFPANVPEEPTK